MIFNPADIYDNQMKKIVILSLMMLSLYTLGFFTQALAYSQLGINLNKYLYSPWIKHLEMDNPIKVTYNKSVEFWCSRLEGCSYQNPNL